MLGGDEVEIPADALNPVIRRQSEIDKFMRGSMPAGYVLDLRGYVLPEDLNKVEAAYDIYRVSGVNPPKVMPEQLADLVRQAAQTKYSSKKDEKLIPELSAVKTNIRESSPGPRPRPPRFWYMLPDFKQRHLPDAFVPRINQYTPQVLPNTKQPLLIDANFSTLWANNRLWTPESISSLLNSVWGQACMESTGTPMGGGALKLEATHIRRMPMPKLSRKEIQQISKISQKGNKNTSLSKNKINKIDNIIIKAILNSENIEQTENVKSKLHHLANNLKQASPDVARN